MAHIRDIARALRATVDGSYTDWKFGPSDWARMKFEGARYIDQDGILTDEGRVGRMESKMDHPKIGVKPPPTTTRIICGGEQEPTVTWGVGVGSEEVPAGNRHPIHAMELLPVDFFADPSVLFSGPSFTGFTGIDDQRTAEETTSWLFHNF
jgi:hypothetical protein